MFGTMGFSELILILVIVLIIFGAGRLPQIGEGVGKALKGFRKEVTDVPQPASGPVQQETGQPQAIQTPTISQQQFHHRPQDHRQQQRGRTLPMSLVRTTPVPRLHCSTTLASNPATIGSFPNQASASAASPVLSMEERAAAPPPRAHASYPPLPAGSQAKPTAKRPSAIVNKDAVARVQAQQAALKATQSAAVSPDDLQHFGEGLGEVVRTFRQAVTDVRNSVDPQMGTIQAELDAAKKEIQQSMEAAKELPPPQEDPQKSA